MTDRTRVTAHTHLQTVLLIMGPDWVWVESPKDWHLVHALNPRIRLYVEGNLQLGYTLALRVDLPLTMWDEDSHIKWPLKTKPTLARIPKREVNKAVAHYLRVLPR